ncbi:hypothetical protein B0I33_1034 [Prauserella shujinwangii]|uniref:Uncharacterized protein n=1 Tax=Prauserella shujinwangii TaxID=1453103 RepID=A0A2T0LY40_9PSEU|nr:hypothetical protein [Prauserella shujinwangii]PRX48972.1 hypothetical protein B0I33_1034 [Prauserella shujinwangii]
MLKKAGIVTATTAALMMAGGTAFAAPAEASSPIPHDGITFSEAYYQFIEGGGALGYGASSLVAGAYTGIARTPHLIMNPAGD